MDGEQAWLLGAAIKGHNPEIVTLWLREVREDVDRSGRNVPLTELQDAVGAYLDRLADALRSELTGDVVGAGAWQEIAREHALTRVRLGFDIEQLVREFILLRKSILRVLDARGFDVDATRATLLSDLIEAAIAVAVRSYIDSRDYEARKQEAEHIGFVTHELRNPLMMAMLAATRLQNDAEVATRSGRLLDLLGKGLGRMKELVERVLLTERLDANAVEPQLRDVPIDQLMEDGVRGACAEAERKHLRFVVTYNPALVVRADLGLALSALQNLVDNAVKFTDAGSVEIAVEDRGSEIAIHVRDTCPGLSDEELATIFEPFRRGHSAKPGSGLGLAIASRAVRAQGGRIEAESLDEGCHFWMTLAKPGHDGRDDPAVA